MGKNNKLQASHIRKIVDTVAQRKNVEKFAQVVSLDEVKAQGYNLNIPRYVNSAEDAESWDIYATMYGGIPQAEIDRLHHYWDAFPTLKNALFESKAQQDYWQLQQADNIADQIEQNEQVQAFIAQFNTAFEGYATMLADKLISDKPFNIAQKKEQLTADLFGRLNGIALLDPYTAYQTFDDAWQAIATDLEILQSEGKQALKQVNPNLIIKKKDGKETEVQDGWVGHILPFEMVQKHLLSEKLTALQTKENRLSEIAGELETLLGELSEEDKASDAINESGDAFVGKEIAKALKNAEGDFKRVLTQAQKLLSEEKMLKSQIKTDSQALHLATKETIENLSDVEAIALQKIKWITPLAEDLHQLPQQLIQDLGKKVQALADKYGETLLEIEEKLAESQQKLAAMLDLLHGSNSDMLGSKAWQAVLKGEENAKK